MKDLNIQSRIMDLLLQCLRNIPSILAIDYLDEKDAVKNPVIEVETVGDKYRLIIETKNNGQPRHARDAVARLLMKSVQSPENTYPIFAAPFISDAAAEICHQVGAGYMDLAGNCRLAFDGIYIERKGRPNRYATKRSLRSLYHSRSSRVLRALLFDPNLKWKLTELSQASGVSIGQAFNVKQALVDREWAIFDKDGLYLSQPEKVLRDWGEQYEFDKNTSFNAVSPSTPLETEAKLARYFQAKELRYAFTSCSAYKRLDPDAEVTHISVYMDAAADFDLRQTAEELNFESFESGSNVTLLLPYDEGVFFGAQEMDGLFFVSPVQAYLDLIKTDSGDIPGKLMRRLKEKEWHPVTES